MKSAGLRRVRLVLAGAVSALALGLAGDVLPPGASSAYAQQGKAGRSAAANPAAIQGAPVPGVTAPATTPGGLPASFGSAGRGISTMSIREDEFADEVGEDAAPRQPPYAVPGLAQTSSGCVDVLQAFRNAGQRMAGVNGDRLRQAGLLLDPDVDQAREVQVLKLLLASFQEELQKQSPDLTLAGTYLGVAAELPITEEMVAQIADSLCVPVRKDQAASIAGVAEVQRQKSGNDQAR